MGDLIGTLVSPEGPFSVLNSHSPDGAVTNRAYIYDDSSEKDIIGAQRSTDGGLRRFGGQQLSKDLTFYMEDNAFGHLGTNIATYVFLERQIPLTEGITGTLLSGACRDDFVVVPDCATNLTFLYAITAGTGPVSIQACLNPAGPCTGTNFVSSSGEIVINQFTDPPIAPGVWFFHQCN